MEKCGICGSDMVLYEQGGIKIRICKKCKSVHILKDDFEKLAKHIDSDCEIINLFEINEFPVNEEKKVCPICNAEMDKIYYNGVIIDRCKNCNLLVFEDGELAKYFSKISPSGHEIINNAKFVTKYFPANRQNTAKKEKEADMYNQNDNSIQIQSTEEEFKAFYLPGIIMLIIALVLGFMAILLFMIPFMWLFGIIAIIACAFFLSGLRVIKPQEAMVLTFFGKYAGSIKEAGFHWVNPLTSSYISGEGYTLSLKARTLDNGKQKINDESGNPIEVGIMVTWEIQDTAKAIFNVDNYSTFLSAQCDSALRNIVRLYPYDAAEDSDKQTLRGDSAEISEKLKYEIQKSVLPAGINIIDARITHLAYSSEIAAAMLQRQQAKAIIEAKRAIVDGAVGMVEMALDRFENNGKIHLDEKTKANMVNNLLVVLCANKESQPVIKNDII